MGSQKLLAALLAIGLTAVYGTVLRAEDPKPAAKPAVVAPQPAAPEGFKVDRDVLYVPGGDKAQALDIYYPETAPKKPLPLVISIHGGGWNAGSKSGAYMKYLLGSGYVVASVEYRFSRMAKFPAQIQDCQAAIRFLRANAGKYSIDPKHVGVWGDSAGGHLVALLGTTGGKKAFPIVGGNEDQSDAVQAVIDWYGPTDFHTVMKQAAEDKNVKSTIAWDTVGDPYSNLIGVKLGEDKEKELAVSPVHYVSKESSPILIMHGDHDTLVPFAQTEEFVEKLKASGVDVTLQKFPGAGHGGPAFYSNPKVRDLMKAFFDKQLKGADVKIELIPEAEATLKSSVK